MAACHEKAYDPFVDHHRKVRQGKRVDKKRGKRSGAGFTLMEAMVALVICTFLFMLLLTIFGSFQKISKFQQSSAELESQFLLSSQIIEKDIRLAGFGIPGNGLYPRNFGTGDFSLVVLSNVENVQTTLSQDAGSGGGEITVKSSAGISGQSWVCLCRDSTVRFYQIGRVGLHCGSDTVVLKDSTLTKSWNQDSVRVYFAKGVEYGVTLINGKRTLVRTAPTSSIAIGASIDSFAVCQKTPASSTVGDFSRTKTLGITIGGRVGQAGRSVAVTRSFDVEIRNSK
jgi:hypothetical protein